MFYILIPLLLAFMGLAVYSLIRGIIAFLKTTEADLKGDGSGPSASSIQQNKMMRGRIMFHAVAIVIVVIMLAMAHR